MPTFYRADYASTLDLFFISNELIVEYSQKEPNSLEILDFQSDHRAVLLDINLINNVSRRQPVLVNNYRKADWKQLRNIADDGLRDVRITAERNMTTAEIDDAVTDLAETIKKATDATIPKVEIKSRGLITLSDDLLRLIQHKKKLRRRWQRMRYNHNEVQLRSEIAYISKIIKERIQIEHNAHWTQTLQNIKVNNNTFKHINSLAGSHTWSDVTTIANNVTTPREKANVLGQNFHQIHKKNLQMCDDIRSNDISDSVKTHLLGNYTLGMCSTRSNRLTHHRGSYLPFTSPV